MLASVRIECILRVLRVLQRLRRLALRLYLTYLLALERREIVTAITDCDFRLSLGDKGEMSRGMKRSTIALLALTSLVQASARPALLPLTSYLPLTYEALAAGERTDVDNGEMNDPEIAVASAQRVLDDKTNLAVNEAPRSLQTQPLQRQRQSSFEGRVNHGPSTTGLRPSAPLGADGRVVDTAEVAAAKAAHAAAHLNERLNLANEAARSELADNNPEITGVNEKDHLASEAVESGLDVLTRIADDSDGGAVVPLVLGNGVVLTALVRPVDSARSAGTLDSQGVPVNGSDRDTANYAKTVDRLALAIAGPALAYGRFIY